MDGARQVYAGIDFPASLDMADSVSTDYFVQVDHELRDDGSVDSGWEAHWNADKRANHAQASLGPVSKQGACFINASARICLWAR